MGSLFTCRLYSVVTSARYDEVYGCVSHIGRSRIRHFFVTLRFICLSASGVCRAVSVAVAVAVAVTGAGAGQSCVVADVVVTGHCSGSQARRQRAERAVSEASDRAATTFVSNALRQPGSPLPMSAVRPTAHRRRGRRLCCSAQYHRLRCSAQCRPRSLRPARPQSRAAKDRGTAL